MLGFMDYVQHAFYQASGWDYENVYPSLTATARNLLEFQTPRGIHLSLSSLASPNFATSYSLGSVGLVDGSLSYLYSSIPLHYQSQSSTIDLKSIIRGYRQIQELRDKEQSWMWEEWHGGRRIDKRDALFYGRLYLPQSHLEALYLKRISPTQQLKLSAVSNSKLRNGGTILALHQYDVGKYSTESLYSTDGGLLGIRGLYNFGPDPRNGETVKPLAEELPQGRFSAGGELYYGALNKSGGVSVGGRFATMPSHRGIPFTASLTLNPLMGNISSTYAVRAGPNLSLCSKFDFNVYSYESDVMMGCELWRMKVRQEKEKERSFEAKMNWTIDPPEIKKKTEPEEVAGVLKARMDQNGRIGLLWEGRVKEILFSLGSEIDVRRRDQPFRTLGLELQYSS